MRTHHALAALLLLPLSAVAASCILETSGADEEAAVIGDLDENAVDGQVRATRRDRCLAAGEKGTGARENFCGSRDVPKKKKRGCWEHVNESRQKWNNWCYWNF
jgi:hypothetical protein